VNVTDDALWEVVVDHQIDALEVDSSAHEVGANEDPSDALTKVANHFITFPLRTICVYDIHIYTLVQQFLKSATVVIYANKQSEGQKGNTVLVLAPLIGQKSGQEAGSWFAKECEWLRACPLHCRNIRASGQCSRRWRGGLQW